MGLFSGLKSIGQGLINFVTSPFKSAVSSISTAAATGATKGVLEQLESIGINQAFVTNQITPALEGVVSVGELAKVVKPWVGTVAFAGTGLIYVAMGYLVLNAALSFARQYKDDELGKEILQALKDIQGTLKELKENAEFQTYIQLQQWVVQQQILRQEAARSVSELRPSKLRGLSKKDKARASEVRKEAQEILDKPKPIVLSSEVIDAVNLAMVPYLRSLFAIPNKISSTEELLNAVSSNMSFNLLNHAFVRQDFSGIQLSTKDALNFGYLNKVSNGQMLQIVERIEQRLINKAGRILDSSVALELSFKNLSPFTGFYKFNGMVVRAQNLATSEEDLIEPTYKHNVDSATIDLAIQYREIKCKLLSDPRFKEFLDCNNDPEMVEKVSSVLLNRALLGMSVKLSQRYNLSEVLKDSLVSFPVGVCTGLGVTAPVALTTVSISAGVASKLRPRIGGNVSYRFGQVLDFADRAKCFFFGSPEREHKVSRSIKLTKREREEQEKPEDNSKSHSKRNKM